MAGIDRRTAVAYENVLERVAQFVFIPFMTTGAGDLIGDWYGTGPERGLALLFTIAGTIGLVLTLLAMRSRQYRLLSERYADAEPAVHGGPA